MDVDQLAARMKTNVDLYKQIRDQSLAAYAKLHPTAKSYDTQAKTAIRLAAYLWVWGDFYGEDLWSAALDQETQAAQAGAVDPLLQALPVIHAFEFKPVSGDHQALFVDGEANKFAASDYPVCFKFWFYSIDAKSLVAAKTGLKLTDPKTADLLPAIIDKAVKQYGELIKAHINPDLLASLGDTFIHGLQSDGNSVKLAGDKIDAAFAQDDPVSVVRDTMQGKFYITYAWSARGIGFANTVTADAQKQFAERLQKADTILEAAYARHPDAGMIAREMLTVELGQGKGRDRMELWFQRAIKANPDDYNAYLDKAYYLNPQWYGTEDDLWNFDVECANTRNWSSKIPMILIDNTVTYFWKKHPDYFTDDKKWAIYEATFRGFLDHYPNSNHYRSIFARWAAESGHYAVSEEQFRIMGDNWDRVVFPAGRYEEMRAKADQGVMGNPNPGAPPPAAK
jgi:hypothetical protein